MYEWMNTFRWWGVWNKTADIIIPKTDLEKVADTAAVPIYLKDTNKPT